MDGNEVAQIVNDAAQVVETVVGTGTTDEKVSAIADAAQDAAGVVGVTVSDADKATVTTAAQGIANAVKDTTQPRYKSWLLWVSVGALIVLVVRLASGNSMADTVGNITTIALGALASLGIINNPNSKGSI